METRVCKCCGKELPISEFSKNKFGITSVCKTCNSENRRKAAILRHQKEKIDFKQEVQEAKMLRLSQFTPRELMEELKRRGFDGELTYTEVKKVKLSEI